MKKKLKPCPFLLFPILNVICFIVLVVLVGMNIFVWPMILICFGLFIFTWVLSLLNKYTDFEPVLYLGHVLMGWHSPNNKYTERRGVNLCSKCQFCDKEIIQDSQGNWF